MKHAKAKRPIDYWRAWAEVSLPVLKVSSSVRTRPGPYDRTYTLEENGIVVGTWKHSEVPWLRAWLHTRLPQLHGAWNVAQRNLASVSGGRTGGKKTGVVTTKNAKARETKVAKVAKQIRQSNPRMTAKELAATLQERNLGTFETLRKKVRRKKA
jgi:hypothetical protein